MLIVIVSTAYIGILMAVSPPDILLRHGNIEFPCRCSVSSIDCHLRSRRSFHGHFASAVPVKIIADKLGIMGASPYIRPHIKPPQKSSVQFVTVDIAPARIALDGNIMRIGGIPFDKILILSVSIHIRD